MEKPLAFLDFLACKEIKDAFVSGRMAFVLSEGQHNLLWLDGKAAKFFGFSTLSEALEHEPFFDITINRQIENGLTSGRSVLLRGKPQAKSFILSKTNVSGGGSVILAQENKTNNANESASLITGLADKDISAAILDEDGNIIASSDNFQSDGDATRILLQSIDNDMPVKTVVKHQDMSAQVSAIRLRDNPAQYLVLSVNISNLLPQKDEANIGNEGSEENLRFTWKMAADGTFKEFSETLLNQHYIATERLLNRQLEVLATDFHETGFLDISENVAKSQSWDNMELQLNDHETGQILSITLSGLPIFDLNETLQGFRGFGTLTIPPEKLTVSDEPVVDDEVPTGGLSSSERSAFREIAERLKSELHLSIPDVQHDAIKPLPIPTASSHQENEQAAFLPKRSAILNLLDTATDGVIWLDKNGNIQALSDAASALTGYDNEDILQHDFSTLFSVSTSGSIKKYLKSLGVSGAERLFNRGEKAELNTKDQTIIKVLVTLVPLSSDEGYAALLRDMTNVAPQAQEQFDNEALAETIHEIRTPLNAMIGFADIMREERFGKIDNERYRGYLRDIVSSGKHILTLVNRFLDKAKSRHDDKEKSPQNVGNQHFDVVTQLRKSVSLLENQANENGIIIRVVMPPKVPSITIDAQEFRQIIWNILSNSIRFTASGGQIVVHLAYTGANFIKISISDNGIGMSEEEMARALEPYGQINRRDSRQGDAVFIGTGLGLPTTKSLVEKNGGRFLLLSKPNQGTTVELFFPVVQG